MCSMTQISVDVSDDGIEPLVEQLYNDNDGEYDGNEDESEVDYEDNDEGSEESKGMDEDNDYFKLRKWTKNIEALVLNPNKTKSSN